MKRRNSKEETMYSKEETMYNESSKEETMYNECSKYTEPYELTSIIILAIACVVIALYLFIMYFLKKNIPNKYVKYLDFVAALAALAIPITMLITAYNLSYISNNKRGIINGKIRKCESILMQPYFITGIIIAIIYIILIFVIVYIIFSR